MRRHGPIQVSMEMAQLMGQWWMTLAEAQMVISVRLCGLAGVWNVAPLENQRIMREKAATAQAAVLSAGRAAMTGASPAAVTHAALKPVDHFTTSNVRRPSRRGPGPNQR
ncbi:MAG: hypothetical protein B7Z02_07860 [Rhodobacterales bacterium 32-67-9]|nr:MAG: hypothetical protein B7Z02_07860 [Rhodobacterales bacterium 32-67-9]